MQSDGRFRFDTFVVGSANRLAVAAARAVAEAPGTVYNPLFIYSSSGLGKTHIVGAIGHQARQLQPDLAVEYVSLDDFVEQLHAAVAAGQTESFKQRYQHVDLLLLDDVQFLTGQRETQTEMLRLFNALQGSGRQIVMASDRPPTEIADVDERLVTRLSGGLIVDIGAPDFETRVAILRNKCAERDLQFAGGVIEELARIDFQNVRELQGALNRLAAYQRLGDGVAQGDVRRLVGAEPAGAAAAAAAAVPDGARAQPAASRSTAGEFQSFLTDMASAVALHVEGWRARLGEAAAFWRGEGYRVAVLERALELPKAPDLDGLLKTFSMAIDHLKELEQQAAAVDPALGGADVFRDPERVAEAEQLVERALAGQTPPPGPSAAFTREAFEVGASNQMAVGAADAVIEDPGHRYNPLFVHGPSGTGKTHLAHAIGNELINVSGGAMTVSFVSAEQFMDELIAAMQDGSVERWRARYRAADALVIDDVHFVAGKERTQDELFHVFNALHSAGKQIILSSDRPPKELDGLEERLRSRFEGGLVVGIQYPDRMLRRKLFARFLAQLGLPTDADLLAYLAERSVSSVREIIGTVNRLAAAAETADVPVTVELARGELEGAGSAPVPAPTDGRAQMDPFFLDDEKVVWDWADVTGRIIEELR